jgi:Ca2+-transporting ATPase
LSTEPPHPTELKKERIRKNDKIILKVMWRNILGVSLYQLIVMIVLLFVGPLMFEGMDYAYYGEAIFFTADGEATPRTYHYTFMFFTFIIMQLFNSINSRKLGLK